MFSSKIIKWTVYILITVFFSCCSTSYEITKRSELNSPLDVGELTVITKDGREHCLEFFNLKDSVITGFGTITNDTIVISARDTIRLSNIRQMTASKTDWLKTVVVTGVSTAIIYTFISLLSNNDGLNNEIVIVYPGCDGPGRKIADAENNKLTSDGFAEFINSNSLSINESVSLSAVSGRETLNIIITDKGNYIELEGINKPTTDLKTLFSVNFDFLNQ